MNHEQHDPLKPIPKAAFNVFIDLDGPIADFDRLRGEQDPDVFKNIPGIYAQLPEAPAAAMAIAALKTYDEQDLLRVWVLTKVPTGNPYAYAEKALWVRQHFSWLADRLIMSHDKSVIGAAGDLLLDDRPHKANADLFPGELVVFKVEAPSQSWELFIKKIDDKLNS